MKQHQNKPRMTSGKLEEGCGIENAEYLIEESKILLENKRLARAFFLTSIAIEELEKFIIMKSVQTS